MYFKSLCSVRVKPGGGGSYVRSIRNVDLHLQTTNNCSTYSIISRHISVQNRAASSRFLGILRGNENITNRHQYDRRAEYTTNGRTFTIYRPSGTNWYELPGECNAWISIEWKMPWHIDDFGYTCGAIVPTMSVIRKLNRGRAKNATKWEKNNDERFLSILFFSFSRMVSHGITIFARCDMNGTGTNCKMVSILHKTWMGNS